MTGTAPARAVSRLRHRGLGPAFCALAFLAFAGLRITMLYGIEEPLRPFDSAIYLRMAHRSLADVRFWAGDRPWTVPLVFKLLSTNTRSIMWFQLAVSVACWTALAAAFARTLRVPLLRAAAFAIVLVLGSTSRVALWDGVIMSESISLSLMALLVATWLGLVDRWRWGTVAIVAGVAVLWAFARDSNALVLLAASVVSGVAALGRRARRHAVVAVLLAVCWLASSVSANLHHRWTTSFVNVIGQRILPSPERTAGFAARGMPITPALTARSGKLAWSDQWAFFRDPDLKPFGVWMRRHGRSTYVAWLVAHPVGTLLDPLRDLDELLTPDLHRWRPHGFTPMLGGLDGWIHGRRGAVALATIAAALAACAIAISLWWPDRRWVVPLALIVLAVPHALVVWHGDPSGIDRHAAALGVQLRLATALLLILLADVVWPAREA